MMSTESPDLSTVSTETFLGLSTEKVSVDISVDIFVDKKGVETQAVGAFVN